ncbi:methyltransferase domain-containing protein [Candidatus Woesearchaeota archaeon]|nr:methyltransferase domain-containing protein [Candidatus Woesearchaeota archaeon]
MKSKWDSQWEIPFKKKDIISMVEHYKKSPNWLAYMKLVPDYRGMKVIELGSGRGMNSLMMALSGAKVTLVDSSENAMSFAKKLFRAFAIDATFIVDDVMKFRTVEKFDLVHSEGLAEHFKSTDSIIKRHLDLAKKGGKIIIFVPNTINLLYRFSLFYSQHFGEWKYGHEYLTGIRKIKRCLERMNAKVLKQAGYNFLLSVPITFIELKKKHDEFLYTVKDLVSIYKKYKYIGWVESVQHPLNKYFGRSAGVLAKKE